ncbi:MAG: crossover junction endodeoxyribonuclease RuvC [Bacteroidota bacterium]|nr:crossover junction endodeoxyribonuclease RuvC [Bacteroidota bacterium]MDP4232679.1 crossover junction endodeoxyribonuclease RuvC [Bacteroidota bacterium]MDP4243188.1 crossover junction endodeoxyribonuclease RuvC [Bacteroidota bacterium]MDP4287645.1 crossover junction endodeoxyribonuclease RuvC [Bacteroidota bacterium]
MIILGIDPGTLVTGYGVIETAGRSSSAMIVIEYGTVESKRISTLPLRLRAIFTRLAAVIERTAPDELAIESAFYHKNVQSTLKLGHARGVAILAGVLKELPTAEYSPREIKRAVVGNGNASKEQVEFMVRSLLKLEPTDRKLPDAYDALAVAITHAARGTSVSNGRAKNWKQFLLENPDRIKK